MGTTTYEHLHWLQQQFEYLQDYPKVEECAPESIELLKELKRKTKIREDKLDRIYKVLLGVHKSIGMEELRDSLLEAIGLVEEIRMEGGETLFDEAKGQRGRRFSN
jgi:hypothetical protein